MMATAAHADAPESGQRTTRHFGKYRGTVSNNKDPRNQGRIKAKVPEMFGEVETGWALPCAPYAGSKTGAFTVPAVGAGVWLEFEAGDVSRPIWVGCWWSSEKQPTDEGGTGATPDVRILRSEQGMLLAFHDGNKTIALSDSNGSNILKIEVQQGLVTLQAATKVVVEAPQIELVANATHPGVFGDTLSTYLNQIVTMFNSHVHPGQMAASIPVSPAPPQPMLQPPSPSMLSTKVKLG